MSLLLHILTTVVFFSVILVVVLTLLTWLTTSKSDQTKSHSLGEWPEDKATLTVFQPVLIRQRGKI
jgi:hypothetical protein